MTGQRMQAIDVATQGVELDFDSARAMAGLLAGKVMADVMMAWYDGATGKGHPDASECTDKPGWLAYAESHGGNL
jgi:hypothetical protein